MMAAVVAGPKQRPQKWKGAAGKRRGRGRTGGAGGVAGSPPRRSPGRGIGRGKRLPARRCEKRGGAKAKGVCRPFEVRVCLAIAEMGFGAY